MLSKPMRRLACTSATASQASLPLHSASCRSIHSPAASFFVSSSAVSPSTFTTAKHQQQHQQHQPQRGHQRRPSSSKASCPPSGNKSPPNEDDKRRLSKNTVSVAEEQSQNEKQASQRLNAGSSRPVASASASSRRNKVGGAKDVASTASKDVKDDPFANLNLPIVPPTNHLNLGDVKISSFFSLHRPISVTTSFPPTSSNADSFNSIFASRPAPSQKTNDVIYTLSNMTSALEGLVAQHQNGSQSEHDLQWEVVQQQQQQQQDLSSRGQMEGQSLEELVQQFRPFNVPPAPVPFDEAASKQSTELRNRGEEQQQSTEVSQSARTSKRKGKTYTSTLTISESTTPSGQRSWTAFASPFVEQRLSASSSRRSVHQNSAVDTPRQPFLKRMRAKQSSADEYVQEKITTAHAMNEVSDLPASLDGDASQENSYTNGRAMMLISVKRQRKLKMKKHKYKKLMRRTRNLRRKEGRL